MSFLIGFMSACGKQVESFILERKSICKDSNKYILLFFLMNCLVTSKRHKRLNKTSIYLKVTIAYEFLNKSLPLASRFMSKSMGQLTFAHKPASKRQKFVRRNRKPILLTKCKSHCSLTFNVPQISWMQITSFHQLA